MIMMIVAELGAFVLSIYDCQSAMDSLITLFHVSGNITSRKNTTIHQVTTVLATSKNVLLPGHNHMLTTGTDDMIL